MNSIRLIRREFEKHLTNIDTYEVIKQAKSLLLVEIILQDAENQIDRVKRNAKKFSRRGQTEVERASHESCLESEMELLQKSACCCSLAIKCLSVKYTNEEKLYSIYNKLISDLQLLNHGHEWLFNQEILKNANDVVLNAQRMRRRIQRGVTYLERGATHYEFVTSRASLIGRISRFMRDEIDVAKFAKER
uniref:Uncharacterized protein LOC111128342 isoform X1 n=1 Tax=Crassostrea virginica TaxID=6565 RepID=A0A8B8DPI5_CRAVI|nr:uncharacterized protein LOC111128342 isoform X1 [Crassostrea virginica]